MLIYLCCGLMKEQAPEKVKGDGDNGEGAPAGNSFESGAAATTSLSSMDRSIDKPNAPGLQDKHGDASPDTDNHPKHAAAHDRYHKHEHKDEDGHRHDDHHHVGKDTVTEKVSEDRDAGEGDKKEAMLHAIQHVLKSEMHKLEVGCTMWR